MSCRLRHLRGKGASRAGPKFTSRPKETMPRGSHGLHGDVSEGHVREEGLADELLGQLLRFGDLKRSPRAEPLSHPSAILEEADRMAIR